jgi:hypothetical protein
MHQKSDISKYRTALMLGFLCLSSAFAETPNAEPKLDWSKLAGKPVTSIFFTRLRGFEQADIGKAAGPKNLIIDAGNKKYLLTFFAPCWDLDFALQLGVSSQGNRIYAGFDRVLVKQFGNSRHNPGCRIQTIQPVDTKALSAAKRSLRAAKRAARANQS